MKRIKEPRATLKTAKALVEKVLGTAKGPTKDRDARSTSTQWKSLCSMV